MTISMISKINRHEEIWGQSRDRTGDPLIMNPCSTDLAKRAVKKPKTILEMRFQHLAGSARMFPPKKATVWRWYLYICHSIHYVNHTMSVYLERRKFTSASCTSLTINDP